MSDLSNTEKLAKAITALVKRGLAQPGDSGLVDLSRKNTIPSQRGESRQREGGGGAGISSPLTEDDYTTRTYYGTVGELTSSDGIIVVELQALHTIDLTDSRGREVNFVLDDPYA